MNGNFFCTQPCSLFFVPAHIAWSTSITSLVSFLPSHPPLPSFSWSWPLNILREHADRTHWKCTIHQHMCNSFSSDVLAAKGMGLNGHLLHKGFPKSYTVNRSTLTKNHTHQQTHTVLFACNNTHTLIH